MKKQSLLLLGFLLIFTACGAPTEGQAVDLSAELMEFSGGVELRQAAEGDFAPAQLGMKLESGGALRTDGSGRARLDLSSGTIIRVAPSSFFSLESNTPADDGLLTRLQLEFGQIFIVLQGGQAEVDTPSGLATVRGSYMMVFSDPETGQVYVTCLEGNCGVKNESGTLEFQAGQAAMLIPAEAGQLPLPPQGILMSEEDFAEWLSSIPEAVEILPVASQTLSALQTNQPGLFATLTSTATATPLPTSTPTLEPTATATNTIAPPPIIFLPPPTATKTPDFSPAPTPADSGPAIFSSVSFVFDEVLCGLGVFEAIVTDPDGIGSVYVGFEKNNQSVTTPVYVQMSEEGQSIYTISTATLPAGAYGDTLFYFIKAYDSNGYLTIDTVLSEPYPEACDSPSSFSNRTVSYPTDCQVTFTVDVTDPETVTDVFLRHELNSPIFQSQGLPMNNVIGDTWEVTISLIAPVTGSDVIHYAFEAYDNASYIAIDGVPPYTVNYAGACNP